MSRREVKFLWVGLVGGFILGVLATVIGIPLILGVPHLGSRVDAVHAVSLVSFFLEVPIILAGTNSGELFDMRVGREGWSPGLFFARFEV